MKKILIFLLILSGLLSTNCLMNYYSAQLPEPGKVHIGYGAATYDFSKYLVFEDEEKFDLFGELFFRGGLPYGFDAGFGLYMNWHIPYSIDASIRKQFKIINLFNNDLKWNLCIGKSVLLVNPSAYWGMDLLYGRFSTSFQFRRMLVAERTGDYWDTEQYGVDRIVLRASYDYYYKRLHVVPSFMVSWDRQADYDWSNYSTVENWFVQRNPFLENEAEYSKPYFFVGVSVYFELF